MTEHTDVDANNLCITEDVFEKFQAKSMYEEEELITLSDLLPSNGTTTLSVPDDAKDLLTDKNVALDVIEAVDSNMDILPENVQHTEISTGLDEVIGDQNLLLIENSDLNVFENIEVHTELVEENRPRRGRKKKTVQEASFDNALTEQTKQLQPKRRGRRKKIVEDSNNSLSIEDHMELIHSGIPDNSLSAQNEPELHVEKNPTPQLPKSRGRKKRLVQEPKIDTSFHDTGDSKISEQLDINNQNGQTVGMPTRKRGKKRKTVQNENSNLDGSDEKSVTVFKDENIDVSDDLPISQIRNEKSNTSEGFNDSLNVESTNLTKGRARRSLKKTSTETNIEKNNITSGKKKGRPKKQPQQSLETEFSESQNDIESPTSKIKLEEPSSTVDKQDPNLMETKISTVEIDNDEADEMSLSYLKQSLVSHDSADVPSSSKEDVITSTIESELEDTENKIDESLSKRNCKVPELPDFEYDLENIANEGVDKERENLNADTESNINNVDESLLIEDTSKRPKRRKIKQNFRYQEDSDEDPFANVELSDDEPKHGKRGGRYYSDDEYIPGKKTRGKGATTDSSQSSDLDMEDFELEGSKKQKRKRFSKKNDSPKKKGKKNETECMLNVTTVPPVSLNNSDDIEVCLESSVIKNPQVDESSENKSWGNTNAFENFIAQKIHGTDLKIKKLSSSTSTTSITPLDIPTLDPTAKKLIEISTQTIRTKVNAQGVQTSPPYDIPMKKNVVLKKGQSEKACEFLNSIVKTTSELGVLMTQKSEDFMKKKIHTEHVTDTFKMDYCVRKSFLLFKLAKHNLMQMEEDLANQYDAFLKENDLSAYREEIKTMASTSTQKADDNDSDCEIVDVEPVADAATSGKKSEKSKTNPKTVFLNKELSIKITKKPSEEKKVNDGKKLNIKGRHTVWINDSVILKKVKPTQSFLAQDSRNKKPPDSKIIENIVNEFFREYDRQRAVSVCAPFISSELMTVRRQYVCHYFVASPDIPTGSEHFVNNSSSENGSGANKTICETKCDPVANFSSPKSLFSLCTICIQSQSYFKRVKQISTGNSKNQPRTLNELCLHVLNEDEQSFYNKTINITNTLSLKTICLKKIMEIFTVTTKLNNFTCFIPEKEKVTKEKNLIMPKIKEYSQCNKMNESKNGIKTLFTLCFKVIQNGQKISLLDEKKASNEYIRDSQELVSYDDATDERATTYNTIRLNSGPQSLKKIAFGNIVHLMYNFEHTSKEFVHDLDTNGNELKTLGKFCLDVINANLYELNDLKANDMTINSVNTMSEEAFFNITDTCTVQSDQDQYIDDDNNCYEDEFEPEYECEEDRNDTTQQDNNWVKQVQMNVVMADRTNESFDDDPVEQPLHAPSETPFMVNIKSEILEEELMENLIDPDNVKTEPIYTSSDLTIALENVTTKTEPDNSNAPRNPVQRSTSYDGDAFEEFVSSNKMLQAIENTDHIEEIFSQSALRIRRQFDPDWDGENDAGMSLLVPHTYEPLQITEVKDTLMQSSSDESNKDVSSKKKIDKRKKRTKKVETKTNNKDINITSKNKIVAIIENEARKNCSSNTKNKTVLNTEVAILTRRMRERIRQEEKKVQSSDSENETIEPRFKSEKKKGKVEEAPDSSQKSKKKYDITDIQCNNVDSTEQLDLNLGKQSELVPGEIFTGFSAVDQSEISTYQKYLKDVYDKILPKIEDNDPKETAPTNNEPLINADEPVEYLECEPTLPIFEKEKRKRTPRQKAKVSNEENPEKVVPATPESQPQKETTTQIVDRHGWQCYPIDMNDKKLYQNCQILLDKLPETFVEMYFQYQNITDRSKEDDEVDRLINLQSLKRSSTIKELKRSKIKDKTGELPEGTARAESNLDGSRPESPGSDHYNELTPSEDERSDREDETLAPMDKPSTENNMAKNSLMDDNDTDTDTENAEGKLKKIKTEPKDNAAKGSKRTSGPKSVTKQLDQKPAEHPDLMLTADKMMNKELTLLHAPINLDESVPEVPEKKHATRSKTKNSSKKEIHYRIKNEDDSSSEEEKQWVTTKEKLLKRLEKKQETTLADEAKRTKIVSEYIERRGENPEPRLTNRRRGRRSRKKMLERQKQLRVLTRELLGDDAADSAHPSKRYHQAYFKGRRNIRKVIDKKSLARSTVMANMEEFERKRRLTMKQAKLREVLGCDEGVNVLVINDELCLEYDFEQQQPVVSVHPFFTKIMKAHQYEGVKFMWDACFESLSALRAARGGGCILAHCMGLGKTLQVLALLHTVLTHPGVGMQRVLVCCPLSTVLNWVDEIHKWIGPVTDQIKVFELSKLKKTYERAYQLEDWYSGGGIFIIGYELFRSLTTLDPYLDDVRPTIVKKIRTALLDPGPDIIICDEGHLLKNDCSVLAVAMSRVVTKRRIVLTGTPMQNNLREYYCMVNFVKPNLLGTYAEYSNRFENPIMNGQHRDSSEEDIKLMKARTHILHKVLEGCLQRQEASVLYPYLPKKHEYTVFISLTKCQWDMYKYYLTHYANKAKHGVLKDFHILQKVWSHPQVLHHFHTKARDAIANKVKTEKLEDDLAEEDAAPEVDMKPNNTDIWWMQFLEGGAMLDSLESSNKFVVVFRILDECVKLGDKVLIFSTSLFTMDALEFFLRKINKWSLGQEYYRLDGSVPAEVRQKWCREFNAENNHKTKLFLISTRAGSLGLNMTAANRVIILDTSWNPAHDIQSIFRVYRFGQKKDCYIYRLVALGTMEQKIYERSVTKQAVACRVVDEQQIDRHYNMHELTELYRFDESGSGVASGVAAGVRDVALLRVARLRALHAVHEHDSLLRGSEPALPEHERQAAWSQFQLEHENGQKLENEMQNKIKKIALKRTYNKAAPATAVKAEPGADDSPDFKPKEPKAKRGRAKAHVEPESESILPDPDTDRINTLDPNTEQNMVRKITELLVKHKFSYRDAQTALPELVMNVRRIVMTGQEIHRCDPLTASIARVLMQRQDNMSTPLVNGIIGESVNQTLPNTERVPAADTPAPAVPQKARGGRPRKDAPGPKCRKGYVLEEVPSTSTAPPKVPLFDRLLLPDIDGRTKRKAALAAEKLLGSAIEDGVIDLDDDDDYDSATDSAPETEKANEKLKDATSKPEVPIIDKTPKEPATTKETKRTPKEPKARKTKTPDDELEVLEDVMDTSILLSDDEENILSKTAVELEPEGEVSVHPSLLKNNNFIKIVAHTYLAGNPMLDEDAAMLAARYSTYKAVKELETTGKPITSGPIYDIAVQVLGKPILKKLHSTNHRVDTADDTQSTLLLDLLAGSIDDKDKSKSENATKTAKGSEKTTKATEAAKAPEPEKSVAKAKKTKPKPGRGRKVYIESSDEEYSPILSGDVPAPEAAPAHDSVVPVGLFKTTVSAVVAGAEAPRAEPAAECILPDDARPPAAPRRAPMAGPTMVPLSKLVAQPKQPAAAQTTKPLILKMVRSNNPQVEGSQQFRLMANDRQLQQMPMLVPTTLAPTQTTDTTICLDSDDDDLPSVNLPQLKPIPVSIAPNTANPALHYQAIAPKLVADAGTPIPVSIAPNTANPALHYQAIAPKPVADAGTPIPVSMNDSVKLRLSKVDPSKFILTTKNRTPSAESAAMPAVIDNADPPVRYIVIPKSQVAQMYPPLVPLPQSQVPQNLVANADGTFTLQSVNSQMGNMGNIISHAEKQANSSILTYTSAAASTPVSDPTTARTVRKSTVNTPSPVPTQSVSIDSGRILNYTLDQNKKGSKKPSQFTPSTNDQPTTIAKPPTPAVPPAKPVTPAKPVERQRKVSSSDSESSESDANNDPLSILKDVVHIQADSYEQHSAPSEPKTSGNTATKANLSTPANIQKAKETSSDKTPAAPAARASSQQRKSRVFLESVDLTFYDDEPPAKVQSLKKTSTKSGLLIKSKTPSASNKDASTSTKAASILTRLRVKSKLTAQNSVKSMPSTSKTQATTLNKPSSSSQPVQKKRAAPVETSPPKKKKIDHLMTLKDFDIDDIDDIIELE